MAEMLPDYLAPGLAAVFVGSSVATASASRGHYYSGPGNKFWRLIWDAGLTGDRLLVPEEDAAILRYGLGLTDLVKGRAASSDSLLRASDYDVPDFLSKIDTFRPFVVAFNGKEAARRVFHAMNRAEPALGLSSIQLIESRVFVLPSSSGASANPRNFAPRTTKAEWWRELGRMLKESGRVPARQHD